MKNFQKIDKQKYKELISKLFSTFFHNPEWHTFLEEQFKWLKFEYYLYKKEAVLPLVKFKVLGKEKIISLPFCEYGGPLPLKQGIMWEEFTRDVFNEFGDSIKVKFHPRILSYEVSYEVKPRKDLRGLTSSTSTHWIENLENTSEQELLGSFRKTLRHEIKHAQEQNLQVKKCENLEELKQFYNLYVANLKRKKTVPYTFGIIKYLYQYNNTELLLAFYREKIVAGCLFLQYQNFVHYFLSASDLKYKNLGVNYLLLWSEIKSLIGQDKILDLGATPKDSPLDIFKSGWGGKECPIFILENKKKSERLHSSKLRNLFGLLPIFVIKKLSRYLIKYRI